MGNKLYIGNLDFETTSADLTELFNDAGTVLSAQIVTDRATRRSKGFAFIEMSNEAEALKAIALYNGHLLNERPLLVNEARPRDDRTSGWNGSRGSAQGARPKFREVKHKSRGGRRARSF